MSKKKGDESDLMADFFGDDDLDWLEEEGAAAAEKAAEPAAEPVVEPEPAKPELSAATPAPLPVAPPPPPAFKPAPTAETAAPVPVKLEPKPPEPVPLSEPVPAADPNATWDEGALEEEPQAPTIEPAPEPVVEAAPESVAEAEPEPIVEPAPTAEPPVPEVAFDPPSLAPEDSADSEFNADFFESSGQTPAPMVRTAAPRAEAARITVPTLSGSDDDAELTGAGWKPSIARLIREARRSPEHRGALLYWAARFARRRLGDSGLAMALLDDARAEGASSKAILREHARASGELGYWAQAEAAYEALAAVEEPVAASEALQEAAGAAAQQDHVEGVFQHLRAAVETCPSDVIATTLLLEQLPQEATYAEERQRLTEALAERSPAAAAAALWWAESAVSSGQAEAMLRRALELQPSHTPAALRLRHVLIANGDHAGCADLFVSRAERADGADAAWFLARAARSASLAGKAERAAELGARAAETWAPAAAWWAARSDASALTASDEGIAALLAGLAAERDGDLSAAVQAFEAASSSELVGDAATTLWERVAEAAAGRDPVSEAQAGFDAEDDAERKAYRALILARAQERAGEVDAAREALAAAGELGAARAAAYRLGDDAARYALIEAIAAEAGEGTGAASAALLLALGAPALRAEGGESLRDALRHGAGDPVLALLALADAGLREGATQRLAELARDDAASQDAVVMWLAELAVDGKGSAEGVARLTNTAAQAVFAPLAEEPEPAANAHLRLAAEAEEQGGWAVVAADAATALSQADAGARWLALAGNEALRPTAFPQAARIALGHEDVAGRLDALATMLDACADDAERAVILTYLLEELSDLGNREAFAARAAEIIPLDAPRPSRALAWSAERLGEWRVAVDLLEPVDDAGAKLDVARLVSGPLADPSSALRLYAAIEDDEGSAMAAVAALDVARALDDVVAMATWHEKLAQGGDLPDFRAAHAGWAADFREELEDEAAALANHRRALALRPGSQASLQGARRLALQLGDADALAELYAEVGGSRTDRGEDLERLGAPEDALSMWMEELANSELPLPIHMVLEELHRSAEDYEGLAADLQAQRDLCADPDVQAALDAELLELLGEHLPDSDLAYEAFGRAAGERPHDRQIAARYARMAGARGDSAQAIQTLSRLAEGADNPSEAAQHLSLLGDLLDATGDADGARQAFLDALDHDSGYAPALTGLRRLADQADDPEALMAVLRRELEICPPDERAGRRIEMAEATARAGDDLAAMDAWMAVFDDDPANERAAREVFALARAFSDYAATAHAGGVLLQTATGEERSELLYSLGSAALEHGERATAQARFEEGLESEPPDLRCAEALAPLYERASDWQGLIRVLLVQAENAEGEDAVACVVRAARIAADRRGDEALAANLFGRLLELEPDNRDALVFCARSAFNAGDHERAAELYDRLGERLIEELDLDDFDERLEASELVHRHGLALVGAGRGGDAVALFERALELDGAHLPSLEQVAPLYRARGDYAKASDAYRRILQLARNLGDTARMATTYAELGMVDFARDDHAKAAKRFGKALESDPNHAGALLGMALVYESQDDFENCWKSYNAVIHNASDRDGVILAYLRKGRVLDEKKERFDKAAEHYERCLEVDPEQPVALIRLSELLLRTDRPEDVASITRRAVSLAQITPAYRASLYVARAVALGRLEDHDAARAAVISAAEYDPALSELSSDDEVLVATLRGRLPVV